ncbi:MAG: ATP synthase F1 subunit delta [Akkermansia sp.]|nr:ATP synthase F1 subunit delta [Akkermansia sp.]
MKITKEVQAQARRLMRLCVDADGILQEDKVRMIAESIAERKPRNFVALLAGFTELVRLALAKNTATVTSAIPLTDAEQSEIRARLDARHKGLNYQWFVDPTLIAGMTVKVGDNITDASVRTRIERLSHI